MKSQTKALLASVMVLALALSSIGGVTYSWFSDTETGNIGIGTATVSTSSRLDVSSGSGYDGVTCDDMDITINPSGSADITLTVENRSSVPIDISAKVIIPRYQALWENEGTYIHAGELLLNENGEFVKNDTVWSSYFNGAKNNLKFNNTSLIFKSTLYTHVSNNPDYDLVRSGYYYYDIGSFALQKKDPNSERGPEDSISFNIWVGENFVKEAMPTIYVEVTCTQSRSSIESLQEGTTSINTINTSKPLHLIGQGFIIGLAEETLTNVTSIEVNVFNDTSLKVELTYYRNETNITSSVSGNVMIFFDSDGISGSLIAPAKDGLYILYTFNAGGTS